MPLISIWQVSATDDLAFGGATFRRVQDLRDDALQRCTVHGGTLDHDDGADSGAGKTDRKDLQCIDDGGVEYRETRSALIRAPPIR